MTLLITTFEWEFPLKTVKVVATKREGQRPTPLADKRRKPRAMNQKQQPHQVCAKNRNCQDMCCCMSISEIGHLAEIAQRNLIILRWWSCSGSAAVNERSAHRFSLPTPSADLISECVRGRRQGHSWRRAAQLNWSGRQIVQNNLLALESCRAHLALKAPNTATVGAVQN